MQNKSLVNALISYYSGERFLETFLNEYKNQTFFEKIQLVFVGCLLNDKEKLILNNFQLENPNSIKLIELQTLQPQSTCWNIAIKNSDADYVCIWNIDDLRTRDSIEKQYKKLLVTPKLDATFGYFIISKQFGKKEGKFIDHMKYSKKEYTRSMLLGPFFMFKKSVCEKIGYFDEQLKSGADFDFAIRLGANCTIKMNNSIDGYFLDEGKGLSTNGSGLQPLERTVIELRYGILDKIESIFVEMAKNLYDIENLVQFGKKIHVSNFIKDYNVFIKENSNP